MLKNILKLDGAQQLSKKEQKSVTGGWLNCVSQSNGTRCAGNRICCDGECVLESINFNCYLR